MATQVKADATRITATEAARNFSDIMNRVRYRDESFIIERSGETIARILPAKQTPPIATLGDLARFLQETPLPDDTFADDIRQLIRDQPPADLSDPWER